MCGFVLQRGGDKLHLGAGVFGILQQLIGLLANARWQPAARCYGLRRLTVEAGDFALQAIRHFVELRQAPAARFLPAPTRDGEAAVKRSIEWPVRDGDAAKLFAHAGNAAMELLQAVELVLQPFAVTRHGLEALSALVSIWRMASCIGGSARAAKSASSVGGVHLGLRFAEQRHEADRLFAQALFGGLRLLLQAVSWLPAAWLGGARLRREVAFLLAERFRGDAEGANAHLRRFVQAADKCSF